MKSLDLIKDSTKEKAAIAVKQWRDNKELTNDAEVIDSLAKHLFTSHDLKELILVHYEQDITEIMTHNHDILKSVMVHFSAGIAIGFKYAQYLYEQRELEKIK